MKVVLRYLNKYVFIETSTIGCLVSTKCYLKLKEYERYDTILNKMYYVDNEYEIGVGNTWLTGVIDKIDDPRISLYEEEYLRIIFDNAEYLFGPVYNYFDYDSLKDLADMMEDEIERQIKDNNNIIDIDLEYAIELMNFYYETDQFTITDFRFFRKDNSLLEMKQ